MKRRGFLRSVGAVASAAVVIPAVAAASPKSEPAPLSEPDGPPMTDAEWIAEMGRTRDEILMERLRDSGLYQSMVLQEAVRSLHQRGLSLTPITPAPPQNP